MTKSTLGTLLGHTSRDPDLQAGSKGLSLQEVVRRYFHTPGQVLVLLRTVKGVEPEQVARATKIPVERLRAYETGEEPGPQHMVALAQFFGANLRMLMQTFGAVREHAASESMGIAAQFAGELTEEEKLDLKQLVAAFAAGRRGKRTE